MVFSWLDRLLERLGYVKLARYGYKLERGDIVPRFMGTLPLPAPPITPRPELERHRRPRLAAGTEPFERTPVTEESTAPFEPWRRDFPRRE